MLTLFPPSADDEVLLHAESIAGAILIFRSPDYEGHIHFAFNICGYKADGQMEVPVDKSEEEAAVYLMTQISKHIQYEVRNERARAEEAGALH